MALRVGIMGKEWSTQKMRHYENQLIKRQNSKEFKLYLEKVNETQDMINLTWDSIVSRNLRAIEQLRTEHQNYVKVKETELKLKINPIQSELNDLHVRESVLKEKISQLINDTKITMEPHFKEIDSKIERTRIKTEFCFEKYVRCVAEQFEKDNVPR
jgi:hypothetical protein